MWETARARERERVSKDKPNLPLLSAAARRSHTGLRSEPNRADLTYLSPVKRQPVGARPVRTVVCVDPNRSVPHLVCVCVCVCGADPVSRACCGPGEPLSPRTNIFFNDRICVLLRDVHGQKQPDQG